MKIAIGSDHAGFNLKEQIKNYLLEKNNTVLDKEHTILIVWITQTLLYQFVKK